MRKLLRYVASQATIPLIRPHQCDSEGGRIRGVLLYTSLPRKQCGGDLRRYPERWCAESHGALESRHKQTVDEVQSGDPNSGVCIKGDCIEFRHHVALRFEH